MSDVRECLMRSLWLVGLIVGCGFGPGLPAAEDPSGDPGDDPGDPPGGDPEDPPGGGGGSGSAAPNCDVHDASLRLCLTFDDDPMGRDLLTPPHVLIENTGVTRLLLGLAGFTSTSHIRFAETADFDVANLTIDARIDPNRIGQRGGYSVIENDRQYAVSYDQDQHVQCTVGGRSVRSATTLGTGLHHVACRYDASTEDLRVYIDGNVAGCVSVRGGIPTTGTAGLAIGASYDGTRYQNNYVGSLDALHLYASAIPEGQICSAAGEESCATRCPDGGGGGDDGGGRR
jgi:hypothetical protein